MSEDNPHEYRPTGRIGIVMNVPHFLNGIEHELRQEVEYYYRGEFECVEWHPLAQLSRGINGEVMEMSKDNDRYRMGNLTRPNVPNNYVSSGPLITYGSEADSLTKAQQAEIERLKRDMRLAKSQISIGYD